MEQSKGKINRNSAFTKKVSAMSNEELLRDFTSLTKNINETLAKVNQAKLNRTPHPSFQPFIESLVYGDDEEKKGKIGFLISDIFPDLKRLVEGIEKQNLTKEEFGSIMYHLPDDLEEAYILYKGDPTAPAWDVFEKNFILTPKPHSIYNPANKKEPKNRH